MPSSTNEYRAAGTPSQLSPGTAYSDFAASRERFLETLRRDSELRRIEAAWSLLPADARPATSRRSRPPA
jgi:hypothetical protein